MTATAVAHPNIALVKYWGKADARLALPATGSVSMGLDVFPTTTTVTLDGGAGDGQEARDAFTLNGQVVEDGALLRVQQFLDLVRELAGSSERASVVSENTVPTGAGLASSASGFAALATAASAAYGLDLSPRDLSRLARRGSGSATRSIPGGVAVWHAGDDQGSFAEPVPAPPMAMVVVTIDAGPKPIGSREAMRRTIATSPFYPAWVTSTTETVGEMLDACAAGDFTRIGELTESNALRMHATIEGAFPPIRYLNARSVAVFDAVAELRAVGLQAYATADAGPNVVVLCQPDDRSAVATALASFGDVIESGTGPAARVLRSEQSGSSPDQKESAE
ncbi:MULTISPECIES: diphosphomevalonate decarboxylase [unclassified Curtobacterium]|uniref:diphosphomevalonate decarboxylase n=1 Tax=unclassified Curtobacterium TaxID=257496 RepID=UPI0008DDA179|nr:MULTISPECIES: diphosphomevalonate decarboxylase [unclassified Curtobacterium]OIH97546.1 diphosphomevalonate decarboxylase [Curtobacterium sp. MCBA15_003]OII29221.1 diphosphomevalonate decarboxylase [Curtobacterium sp. MMLR14_006]